MCSMPAGKPTQECIRSSYTEYEGAGKPGSANAPTRDSDVLRVVFEFVVHRGTALRAEMKSGLGSPVADADIGR